MLAYYQTIEKLLEDNGFDVMNSTISNCNILSEHNNGKFYICHLVKDGELYTLERCKPYKNRGEAILTMIKIIIGDDDE